jgi:hypothetical protein
VVQQRNVGDEVLLVRYRKTWGTWGMRVNKMAESLHISSGLPGDPTAMERVVTIAWACLGRRETSWLARRTATEEFAWPRKERF